MGCRSDNADVSYHHIHRIRCEATDIIKGVKIHSDICYRVVEMFRVACVLERIDVHTFGGDATGRYSLHALVFERYGMTNGYIEMGESDTHFVREIFDTNVVSLVYLSPIIWARHPRICA